MPSRSHWHARHDPAHEPVDLLVVGGGVCGLSAAQSALDLGMSVRVLEADRVGYGASGRNAGYLMRGAADNYAAAVREWGRERARELWRMSERSLELLRERGVADLRGTLGHPSCLLAFTEEEERELVGSHTLLEEDGFESETIRPHAGGDTLLREGGPARLGLVNPGDLACDSVEVLGRLDGPLREQGVLAEGVRVEAVNPVGGGVELASPAGIFNARAVLVCLNAFTGRLLPEYAERIRPNRGQMFSADAGGAVFTRTYYMNHGSEYVRVDRDGTLLVGGCRIANEDTERTDATDPSPEIQAALEDFAASVLGFKPEVRRRWAGTMGFTENGQPILEQCGDAAVWVCGGFNGHGMSLAPAYAERAVELIRGILA